VYTRWGKVQKVIEGFSGKDRNAINWYYNPNQDFQEDVMKIFNALLAFYRIN
jgi:hypothetical protein